jgi:hypothetical protein
LKSGLRACFTLPLVAEGPRMCLPLPLRYALEPGRSRFFPSPLIGGSLRRSEGG